MCAPTLQKLVCIRISLMPGPEINDSLKKSGLPITPSRNNISFFSTHLQGDVRMEGNPLR
jgi:hypothetical protein